MRRLYNLLGTGLLAGCSVNLGESREDFATLDGEVLEVALDASSGDVEIRVDPGATETRMTRNVLWNGDEPCLTSGLENGILTLSDSCNGGLACEVDYLVVFPTSPELVSVSTGSGDIHLAGIGGEIGAETGSGDISGSALGALRATASTGSGDVDLVWVDTPENVVLKTGSGDVTLVVPAGTYRIFTSTGSGNRTLDGVEDGASGGTLRIDTGSGDIVIRGR